VNSPYKQLLKNLTTQELLALSDQIQKEESKRLVKKKSIYNELERIAKNAGISIKELEFLS